MKIAVIGSGIAGLSSAHCLSARHDVVLFEAEGRAGGHTNTIRVPIPGGEQPVDTGWIVYNGTNYPNLTALFAELEVQTRPTSMSFAVSIGEGRYEWKGSDSLFTVFAQPSNLLSPKHIRLMLDILRLNKLCKGILASGAPLPTGPLGAFLATHGFSPQLKSLYLMPMAGLIWSCSPQKAAEYPVDDFLHFFDDHSLFNTIDQPQWKTVIGGSYTYVQKILARFRGQLRMNTPVTRLRRGEGSGVVVTTAQSEEHFDRAVCATHSDTALRLLTDGDEAERSILAGIPYNESRCVLHTDESFLPKRRRAWGAWNYLNPIDEIHDRPISGSYWMNLLQGIPGPVNYVVTLNPARPIPAERILYDTVYQHPHYGAQSTMTHARMDEIQGRRDLWWAGAWGGYGFHEDGLKSGLRAVRGIDLNCLPAWAVL